MHQTVNFSDFCDEFRAYNRGNNFSYTGKRALFDYLENYEDGTGETVEMDVIALCCEYSEDDVDDIIRDYDIAIDEDSDDDDKLRQVLEYLNDHTMVVGETEPGMILFAQF
jgi:hypothetical protein